MHPSLSRTPSGLVQALIFTLALLMSACVQTAPPTTPAAPTETPLPSATFSPTPKPVTTTPTPPSGTLAIWEEFPAPQQTPVTPIPPPLTGLVIPDEVRVLAVAGVDRSLPYTGRTDTIALVIYHPRLARASLISVPPDLLGYIPGYTMQRMYTAYAVGGAKLLTQTLAYNLGVKPDHFAVFNLDSFGQLINDLGGINISVLEDVRRYCPQIPTGISVLMDGDMAICYMRLRLEDDEYARNRRQQDVLRGVFFRLVEGGNLVRVPDLYQTYRSSIDSNLTFDYILSSLPMALKLGDPNRIGYFEMGAKELSTWQVSTDPQTRVFLPERPALMAFMQQAVDFVTTPSPLSEVVVTLQYQLTVSPTPTSTSTVTLTPTATPTITYTPTLTPTPTITLTPTITSVPSR